MKTIISDKNDIISLAAYKFRSVLQEKEDAVVALAGGRSVKGLYDALLSMYQAGEISFSKMTVLSLAEYIPPQQFNSCRSVIYDAFLRQTDFDVSRLYFPSPEDTQGYDSLIDFCGGIDLAVLGIGENAHIAYNEPATPYSSLTHVQKLTDATKRQNSVIFGGVENVPDYAVTMGIKSICDARDIMLLAFGEEKAQAVYKMLYGRNDSVVPAAFLQIPMNVSIYLDKEASSKL